MEATFKIEARSAILNVKRKFVASEPSRAETPGVVWDIRQKRNRDPKEEKAKHQKVLMRVLKKKQQNIQSILDEPLPPIYERPSHQSTATIAMPSNAGFSTHFTYSHTDHTHSTLPQVLDKPSAYTRVTSPWSSNALPMICSNKYSRPSSSSRDSCSDTTTESVSHEHWEKKHLRKPPIVSSEVPFELDYLRWSQKISRANFSYFY